MHLTGNERAPGRTARHPDLNACTAALPLCLHAWQPNGHPAPTRRQKKPEPRSLQEVRTNRRHQDATRTHRKSIWDHFTVLSTGLFMCEGLHLQKLVEDCRRYRLDASAMTYERASSCQHLQPSPFHLGLILVPKDAQRHCRWRALRHTRVRAPIKRSKQAAPWPAWACMSAGTQQLYLRGLDICGAVKEVLQHAASSLGITGGLSLHEAAC